DEQDIYQAALKAYRDFQNVVNTAIQEAEEKAELRGLQRGQAMGRAEGREEGVEQERSRFLAQQRALILRLLARQLGTLPDDTQLLIQQLSLDTLEALADALLDFNCMDDLRRWLDGHP
ncbi:MAG: DUF4351 domain-containing protein, partial [Leptolyngbyaceae cyanobacterium]